MRPWCHNLANRHSSIEIENIRQNVDSKFYEILESTHENTLKLVEGAEAATSSQLFFPRFQALILTDATADAQKLLTQAEGILPPGAKAKAKAYLGKARGESTAIANYLKWAKQNNDPKQIVEAGRFALLSGDGDAAREAYVNVLTTTPQALGPDECGQLLQLALNARDTSLALRTARVLHSRNPNRWGIRNNLTWLALLSGENPVPLEKEAHRIVDAVPDNPNFLSTLALAKLLAEKPNEAIRAMRDRRGARLLPGEKALLAAALFAQGNEEEARKCTKDLSAIRMLPEEWALLLRFSGKK